MCFLSSIIKIIYKAKCIVIKYYYINIIKNYMSLENFLIKIILQQIPNFSKIQNEKRVLQDFSITKIKFVGKTHRGKSFVSCSILLKKRTNSFCLLVF